MFLDFFQFFFFLGQEYVTFEGGIPSLYLLSQYIFS